MIDVCLLLEGTYPYVAGGVATWVHQLISAMPDFKFGIISLSPFQDPLREHKYELPPNVVLLRDMGLHDYDIHSVPARSPCKKDYEKILKADAVILRKWSIESFSVLADSLDVEKGCFSLTSFFRDKRIWDMLVHDAATEAAEESFVDYFWTWRGILLPVVNVLRFQMPRARIYHAVSTGYAGILGALAKIHWPESLLFLTEHGVYTHERSLEIAQATWIYEKQMFHYRAQQDLSFFKSWWIAAFRGMSRVVYEHADRILTLFEGNRQKQILEGAAPQKITIIPNGIDTRQFSKITRTSSSRFRVGLIGRVVSIKDIKTFIYAARLVVDADAECDFYIIGPEEEEEEYAQECRLLVESLDLETRVFFKGRIPATEAYAALDLVVLTSLSEAQPYVILEAGCAGIPVVATDVGACREMLEGKSLDDKALGKGGLLTGVSSAEATAQAILQIKSNPQMYAEMSEAARRRVLRYYDEKDLLSRYLNLYESAF